MKRILLIFIIISLVACSPSTSTNQPVPTQIQTVISTATLQPTIATTATDSPIFATLTAIVMQPGKTCFPTDTNPIPLSKDEVVNLEKTIIETIKLNGAGDRYVIDDPILAGENKDLALGGLTFGEGTGGSTELSTDFPGDVMPFPDVYDQKVWRFRGQVSIDLQKESGEIYTFKFLGAGDDLNLLTFGRFPSLGFVYLRGIGKVILPGGEEIKIGDCE